MQSTGRFTKKLKALRSCSYDKCRSCNATIARDEPAYAGYSENGEVRYVGKCCIDQIKELASHIYWSWEADKRVTPDTKLWRYMDFAKFLHLVENRSLFFARVDNLGDRFEGASGLADREHEWNRQYLKFFKDAVRNPPNGHPSPDEKTVKLEADKLLAQLKKGTAADRKRTFVSCWHANTGESEALWKLYCPVGSTGVVIKTTAENLVESLDETLDIELGRVQYVDFRKSFAGFYDRIFWKRKSLAHEQEVRAVFNNRFRDESLGVSMLVNVEKLCISVIPSPFAPPWFKDLLNALIKKYELQIDVETSELLEEPFF